MFFVPISGDENAAEELDRSEADLMNRTTQPILSEITIPALGKHWKSICSVRLQIQRLFDPSNCRATGATSANQMTNARTIRILKSNQNPTDIQCLVHITDAGIT